VPGGSYNTCIAYAHKNDKGGGVKVSKVIMKYAK